jgi:hypothetical protein
MPYKIWKMSSPRIVRSMPNDEFNSHEFILALARKYQKLYAEALFTSK